jgi:ribA/ribD-fused uncharacterized protein
VLCGFVGNLGVFVMLMKGIEYDWLSNMYPCNVRFMGKTYKCGESAFQMMKCRFDADKEVFTRLNGFLAKKHGRNVALVEGWNEDKVSVMANVLRAKFDNPLLKEKLMDLTDPIVEDNYWNDTFWGVCNGRGRNMLGKLLTELREELIG